MLSLSLDSWTEIAAAWLANYLIHSTLLLAAAFGITRWLRDRRPALQECLWRGALLAGFFTAALQLAFGGLLGGVLAPDASASGAALPAAWEAAALSPASTDLGEARETAVPRVAPSTVAAASALPTVLGGIGGMSQRGSALLSAPLAAWLIGLWALGAVVLLGRLGSGYHRFLRLLRGRRAVESGPLPAMLSRLSRRARLATPVRLSALRSLPVPFARGLGRPEICLPERAVARLEAVDQEGILAHEVAHLARRDPAWLLLYRAIEAAFFFQPLNRLARRCLQELAEYRCDDWAARATGKRRALARTLTEVAGWLTGAGPSARVLAMAAPGMATRPSPLGRRVERLLEKGRPEEGAPRWLAVALGLAVATLLAVSPGISRAGEADPPPPAPTVPAAPTAPTAPEAAPTPLPALAPVPSSATVPRVAPAPDVIHAPALAPTPALPATPSLPASPPALAGPSALAAPALPGAPTYSPPLPDRSMAPEPVLAPRLAPAPRPAPGPTGQPRLAPPPRAEARPFPAPDAVLAPVPRPDGVVPPLAPRAEHPAPVLAPQPRPDGSAVILRSGPEYVSASPVGASADKLERIAEEMRRLAGTEPIERAEVQRLLERSAELAHQSRAISSREMESLRAAAVSKAAEASHSPAALIAMAEQTEELARSLRAERVRQFERDRPDIEGRIEAAEQRRVRDAQRSEERARMMRERLEERHGELQAESAARAEAIRERAERRQAEARTELDARRGAMEHAREEHHRRLEQEGLGEAERRDAAERIERRIQEREKTMRQELDRHVERVERDRVQAMERVEREHRRQAEQVQRQVEEVNRRLEQENERVRQENEALERRNRERAEEEEPPPRR